MSDNYFNKMDFQDLEKVRLLLNIPKPGDPTVDIERRLIMAEESRLANGFMKTMLFDVGCWLRRVLRFAAPQAKTQMRRVGLKSDSLVRR